MDKPHKSMLSKRKSALTKSESKPITKKNRPSINVRHGVCAIGYTVDLADLLFTPQRDFLLKNNGQKVRVDDLEGKSIVLFSVPIYESCLYPREIEDMIQAYHELSPLGRTEFVFVPVYLHYLTTANNTNPLPNPRFESQEAYFNHLFSTIPFSFVPFSDVEVCGDRVVETFNVDHAMAMRAVPYWVVIDPTGTVGATRGLCPHLFKLFCGAELHPLSFKRLSTIYDEYKETGATRKSRKHLISKWGQLLASPTRDFLLLSNGDRVPISSLKGKVIGLYFCENKRHPPRMDVIKEVYEEAKLRGYDFEIVQINLHYPFFDDYTYARRKDLHVHHCYKNIDWLTLSYKDSGCMKLQWIFERVIRNGGHEGDYLVIVDPRQAGEVQFEFLGAEIIQQCGVEGYPFTRRSLFETEYKRLRKEVTLQSLFPSGLSQFTRDGFNLVNGSQLIGKRVFVLFAIPSQCKHRKILSILKSKYREQAEGNKFEVVYVSIEKHESECIRDMPWLVHPYHCEFGRRCNKYIFKLKDGIRAAAFDIDGKLIATGCSLDSRRRAIKGRFPFISQDLHEEIRWKIERKYNLFRDYDRDGEYYH